MNGRRRELRERRASRTLDGEDPAVVSQAAIGHAAAAICRSGQAVMISDGPLTRGLCSHLAPLRLQVFTNSWAVMSRLLTQPATSIVLPAGDICGDSRLIHSSFGNGGLSRLHASKLFFDAPAIGQGGAMQGDVISVQAALRLFDKVDQRVALALSSAFRASAKFVMCPLSDIDVLITDDRVCDADVGMLRASGIQVIVASDHAATSRRPDCP